MNTVGVGQVDVVTAGGNRALEIVVGIGQRDVVTGRREAGRSGHRNTGRILCDVTCAAGDHIQCPRRDRAQLNAAGVGQVDVVTAGGNHALEVVVSIGQRGIASQRVQRRDTGNNNFSRLIDRSRCNAQSIRDRDRSGR